MLFIKSLVN